MGQTLTTKDVKEIQEKVNMPPEEIKKWYTEYKKTCKDGKELTLDEFKDIYSKMFKGHASDFVENVFRTFDTNGNGKIDMEEFMIGIGITVNKDQDKKLEWAFKLYDIDGNGTIDKKEMESIVKSMHTMHSKPKPEDDKTTAEERAAKMFEKMDINNDGVISYEEFKQGALNDPFIMDVLNMKFSG